jgi:hypothetical protein
MQKSEVGSECLVCLGVDDVVVLTDIISTEGSRRHSDQTRMDPPRMDLGHAAALYPCYSISPYFPCSAGNVEARYIKLLCCFSSTIKILWLAKVKTLSPSATTSLKDSLKSVFRQALTVLVRFLGRFSISFQSLFGVPGDFNLGES